MKSTEHGSVMTQFSRALGLVLAIVCMAQAQNAMAFPLTSEKPWTLDYSVQLFSDSTFNSDGVVAMSSCSASFVRFKGASDDSLGLIMTNGHCVGGGIFGGMLKPGEVFYEKAKRFSVNLLDRNAARIATLHADKIAYATMTDTDLAFLKLTQTYREIRNATGIEALEVIDHRPQVNSQIEIPSGYWKKTYACEIEAFVPVLKEADWFFKDAIRYSESGCEVIGGTSGSPIVDSRSGLVIGINNTGNESGRQCTLNNPCEIDEDGEVTVIRGRGYGQQVHTVYTCLNERKEIDLSVNGCELPKGGHALFMRMGLVH